ncbi:class I SAM-dependent DNA methyltransferase [Actinokineospora enzanensis]|uniref:class I SAM-dependent DNA methyltransferase n=1 Tax=Actinokineospora enzanensis TaxID=155975 RepID=UPI0003657C60|nr:class I SAM-dependent methyltransferase [Actinokineospora enzanensis]
MVGEPGGDVRADVVSEVRTFYDALAEDYDGMFREEPSSPLARAMLGAFAEVVDGPVTEVGCGPGRVTAYLSRSGVSIAGIDLSPEMVRIARREHPSVPFEVGSMWDLPGDAGLGGLVAWYSIIHTPDDELGALFTRFARAVRPGGWLLVGFQVGDEPLLLERPLGHDVSLEFRRLRPERVVELMVAAGFELSGQLVRAPEGREVVPQALLLARRVS